MVDVAAFVNEVKSRSGGDDSGLDRVFELSVSQAMREVKMGADSDDFADIAILNFVTNAARAGCSAEEIRAFVHFLRQ